MSVTNSTNEPDRDGVIDERPAARERLEKPQAAIDNRFETEFTKFLGRPTRWCCDVDDCDCDAVYAAELVAYLDSLFGGPPAPKPEPVQEPLTYAESEKLFKRIQDLEKCIEKLS
jgi:hypothetical protein